MPTLTLILAVGQDSALLDSRSSVLRAAGYMVDSVLSIRQAIDHFRAGDFDLVALCHSIPSQDRDRLTCLIRASGSSTPVVTIAAMPGQSPDAFADATIESHPNKLIPGIEAALLKDTRRYQSQKTDGSDGDGKIRHTILCVDDDLNLLAIRRTMLEKAGYFVLTANGGAEGLKVFSTGIVDAVILDYAMPTMNGGAVAARMRQVNREIPLILCSGCSTIPQEEVALFNRFIPKGVLPNMLLSAIEEILSGEIHCPLCGGTDTETVGGARASETVVEGRMCLACSERFLVDPDVGSPTWTPSSCWTKKAGLIPPGSPERTEDSPACSRNTSTRLRLGEYSDAAKWGFFS